MIENLLLLNHSLAIASLFGVAITVFLIYDLCTTRRLAGIIDVWGLAIAFAATTVTALMTLVYSEYFGIIPCGLCWLQRIAMYPQVLISGAAIFVQDKKYMPLYGIVLSACGFVIGLYQHYVQMGGSEFVECPTSGGDCARRFFFEFNFMTLPLLAVILFTFLITLYIYLYIVQNKSSHVV